jgi:hypothetical protein
MNAINDWRTEEKNKHTTSTLLSERLEQLGYQCLSDSCDRFTTLRLVPIEIKRKEESSTPLPNRILVNNETTTGDVK